MPEAGYTLDKSPPQTTIHTHKFSPKVNLKDGIHLSLPKHVFYCGGNLDNLVRHCTCREYTEKSLASGRFKPGTLLLYVNSANPCNTISSWESIHLQPPADIWGLPVKLIIPTDTKNMVGGVVPQLPPHWPCDSPWLTVYWPQPSELLLVCCHLHWEKGKDFRRHYHSGRNLVNNSTWLSFGRTITLCINSLP